MRTKSDPIGALGDACMRAYAIMAKSALPDSAFAAAQRRLGDRQYTIAVEALRAGLKSLLTEEREEVLRELDVGAGFGQLAARTRILAVAQRAIEAVIDAAGKEAG